MAEMSLAKRLGVKAGQRMAVVNAPVGFREQLQPLPDGATLVETLSGALDCALVFTREQAAVERDGLAALAAVKSGGLVWLAYPKLTSKVKTDITRDRGWDAVYGAGWRPVSIVGIDEMWSALRFRPE